MRNNRMQRIAPMSRNALFGIASSQRGMALLIPLALTVGWSKPAVAVSAMHLSPLRSASVAQPNAQSSGFEVSDVRVGAPRADQVETKVGVKIIGSNEIKEMGGEYMLLRVAISCSRHMNRAIDLRVYQSDHPSGQPKSVAVSQAWLKPTAGAYMEKVTEQVCGDTHHSHLRLSEPAIESTPRDEAPPSFSQDPGY